MRDRIKVSIIEDDPKITAQLVEALKDKFKVETFEKKDEFLKAADPSGIVIIDFDLKEIDGLRVFRLLKEQSPKIRAVMLSSSNSIPLAVTAAKHGVLEFFRKPLIIAEFKEALIKIANEEEIFLLPDAEMEGTEWMRGSSKKIIELKESIIGCIKSHKDLILFGERGIDKKTVVRIIHKAGVNSAKKLIEIDLASFSKESLEAHFWATLNEVLSSSEADSIQNFAEKTGTVYIEGIESIPKHFWLSVIDFLKNKKPSYGGGIKVIIGIVEQTEIPAGTTFDLIKIPPLRERKEDIFEIAAAYLEGKTDFTNISLETLKFISRYNFYGNYEELYNLISSTPLAGGKMLNINKSMFIDSILENCGQKSLLAAREQFEKEYIQTVLLKVNNEIHLAARFLNIPKTILEERVQKLGI
ncbi:MAG: two-component system NtrC family response regulator [Candidatus Saganbacteria bacterium]|uniref:Two-component system NtrC family response regulator n=1 Tax=Candidatus Saganbacteria bacterium TaxID=2575572 RepID=A0A833L1I7_UNCSA|nr:MAG: two-component system NtrC family response regulator [Candidatus Saganbacteria bacterium]